MVNPVALALLVAAALSLALANQWQSEVPNIEFSLPTTIAGSVMQACSRDSLDFVQTVVDVLDAVIDIIQNFRNPLEDPKPDHDWPPSNWPPNNNWPAYKKIFELQKKAEQMKKNCRT